MIPKLRFLTAGESHGPALVAILENLPAGITFSKDQLMAHMRRRKLGFGRGGRQKIETDEVEVLSGLRSASSIGSPISILIRNLDFANWEEVMSPWSENKKSHEKRIHTPRPGHVDFFSRVKMGFDDMRNGLERASARETAARVALAYFTTTFLEELGIFIDSASLKIGSVDFSSSLSGVWSRERKLEIDDTPLRSLDQKGSESAMEEIRKVQKSGDTLGGKVELKVWGIPLGLGSYTHWDRKLEARLASQLMALNAVKSVQLGSYDELNSSPGSSCHDTYGIDENQYVSISSNQNGGITAGVSTGQEVSLTVQFKPISTLMNPLASVNIERSTEEKAQIERSDYCVIPAAGVICESIVSLVLAEAVLEKFGGDSLEEVKHRFEDWKKLCLKRSQLP